MRAGRPGHPQAVGASAQPRASPGSATLQGGQEAVQTDLLYGLRGRDRDPTLPNSLSPRPAPHLGVTTPRVALASVYTPPPARPARLCLLGAWRLLQAGMPCLLSPWPCPRQSAWQSGVAPQ